MSGPEPRRTISDQVVRIADLVIAKPAVEKTDFINCLIIGPAIIALMGNSAVSDSTFTDSIDSMFWLIPPERQFVVGAVGVDDCTFNNCRFQNIGFAGPADLRDMFERGVAS